MVQFWPWLSFCAQVLIAGGGPLERKTKRYVLFVGAWVLGLYLGVDTRREFFSRGARLDLVTRCLREPSHMALL